MRKFLISLLLANAAATPALAAPDGPRANAANADQQETRAERQQERAERQQAREQRSQPREQAQPSQTSEARGPSNDRSPQVRSFDGSSGARHDFDGARMERSANQASPESVRGWRGGQPGQGATAETRASIREQQADQPTSHRPTNWRMHERRVADGPAPVRPQESSGDTAKQQPPTNGGRTIQWRNAPGGSSGDLVQSDRPPPRVLRTRTPIISHTPREGTQPAPRAKAARRPAVKWNTNWRHDNRYDWASWRRSHRSHFRVGFYYDPFGWGYRPYLVGWRLWPAYYSSRFWISDPSYYRLPYAPPGYRWIRYYDDLILVDTWDGRVVDVIYDFFW